MNNRYLIAVAVTFIVAVAAVLVSQQRAPQTSRDKYALFPELSGRINDVSELAVRDGQSVLTVRRVSGNWSIADADDYPALVDKVKQTVLAVSDLQVIAEKTDNPDLYKRLGVEDPDSTGAISNLLTVSGNGEQLAELVVGKTRRSKSAAGAPGLYLLIPDQLQALLVYGRLSVIADIIDWIRRDIIDIEGDRVNAVRLRPAGGTEVILNRDEPADDLALHDIPEGKEPASEYLLGRMASVLENIYVEGVKKENSIDFSRPDTIIDITTFDGLTATIQVVKSGKHTYAGFSFAAQDSGVATSESPAETDAGEEAELTPEQEAETLNSLVQGWAYRLSSSKAELYGHTLSDLVQDPVEEETE
ncbi:MAG: DUF4340 domain-containing protein [Gammaproteobacteria bacterium]|nr:DUF4340 domain-containing protein [Gammaproteobacteria bacterium]